MFYHAKFSKMEENSVKIMICQKNQIIDFDVLPNVLL